MKEMAIGILDKIDIFICTLQFIKWNLITLGIYFEIFRAKYLKCSKS